LKKVLIITYYWPPSGGAGVQRWVKFARYLKDFGVEPIVLTVDPHNASYPLTDSSLVEEVKDIRVVRTKSREPFNLYRKMLRQKEIPYAGFANETHPGFMQKLSRFVRGNFFIPDARKGWNRYALKTAMVLIEDLGINMLLTTSPPHSTQLIGLKLKEKYNLCWIADLRDPWTDIYYYSLMYQTAWAKEKDRKLEMQVLQQSDNLIVVSESIRQMFGKRIGNFKKIKVIPNGYDNADFVNPARISSDKFVLGYTGTIADNYALEGFFRALSAIVHRHGFNELQINFVGRVSGKYKQLIRDMKLGAHTIFREHVPHNEAIQYMLSSTMLLLAIPKVKNNEGILTGKIFEYLASGKPIIAVGPVGGDVAAILDECKAGYLFDYDDDKAMEDFLRAQIKKWKQRQSLDRSVGSCERYSRKNLTFSLMALLDECEASKTR